VRLKDVRDVLLDTGLGTGGYSVMEQGRIDAVLSANPEARRAIFEEAAGVSRFKIQKKETLRKLERTDQNLARITDLLEERSRRIRSLRIQAGKARRFQELQAALRDLRAALAVIDGTAAARPSSRRTHAPRRPAGAGSPPPKKAATAAEQLVVADEAITTASRRWPRCRTNCALPGRTADAPRTRRGAEAPRRRPLAELERGRQRRRGLVDQRDERDQRWRSRATSWCRRKAS
jgi:DNA repair exonuclease SbcCD ATPase subunit